MGLKTIFCGLTAALLLCSCSADEPVPLEAPVVPDGWQTYSWYTDLCTDFKTGDSIGQSLSLDISLPEGWSLDGSSILDDGGLLRGELDQCFSGYTGELNCNDFYMMLELDGIVTQNGINGSRRRIILSGRNAWCQGLYGENSVQWEYYLWTGEDHLRIFIYSESENDPADEALRDSIIGTITFTE